MATALDDFDPLLETFLRQGYVIVEEVFSSAEVELLLEAFERLQERAEELEGATLLEGSQFVVHPREDGTRRIDRVVWCGSAEPVLSELGRDPRLLSIASQLLGVDAMDQLINQAHFKLPGDGVAFPWHQDSRHRRHGTPLWTDVDGRGSFVETFLALDPMGHDNGPLKVIPGSHRQGHIPFDPETGELPEEVFNPAEAITVTLEPGSLVAFGPYLIHGSEPNTSSRPRRAFLNGFAVPGANHRVYPGEGAGRRVHAPT